MRSFIFKVLYFIGIPRVLRFGKKNKLTILSIHRVSEEEDYFFSPIKPANFEKLLVYLQKNYTIITFKDLLEVKRKWKKPPVILSFDDGYSDFYEKALPILKKYNLPSNHNVVNECVNQNMIIWTQRLNNIFNHCKNNNVDLEFILDHQNFRNLNFGENWMKFYLHTFKYLLLLPKNERLNLIELKENELFIKPTGKMMNWEQVKECSINNVEIGCHTYSHDVLSTIIENRDVLFEEIRKSKTEIEEKINKKVNIIALPNGQGNLEIDAFINEVGFDFLLYVNEGVNSFNNLSSNAMNKLNRISLIDENPYEMYLRVELFHSKLRKNG